MRINSLWDNFKRSNIRLVEVPEGEEKAGNWKSKNIVKANFSNLLKEIDMQFQEVQSSNYDGYKEAHSKMHHY